MYMLRRDNGSSFSLYALQEEAGDVADAMTDASPRRKMTLDRENEGSPSFKEIELSVSRNSPAAW